jgi:transcriptional regulator with XRE-family HTH domain
MDLSVSRRKIGSKIRELRERENWNQSKLAAELAKALGSAETVASATISRYEEGKRSVKSEVLDALAGIFRVNSSFFYEGENKFSEPHTPYGADANTKKLAVIEEIPFGFPAIEDEDISGFAEFPRFLFQGAKYIIRVGDGFSCGENLTEGDYIIVAPASEDKAGAVFLYKVEGIFFVGSHPKKALHAEIAGIVIGIIKKP